jgi:glycosyltransferase involved in cell wall biosynthesis
VGRLSPEKGCSLFAAAASKANVRSVFVGSGQEEKKILLINEYSEIKGWCNRSEVINNILLSRAIVYPSLLHETQGLAVLEAAALGIPAIVSDGCAARDLIEDGVTGFLFKHGSIDDLSRKISLLKNDPNISFTMGQAAYNRYWENPCTLERHAKELIKCYSEILYDSQ